MTINRWWHAAALLLSVVLAGVLLMSELEPWRLALGLGSLAAFMIAWALLASKAEEGNRQAVALTVITIITAGVGTAAQTQFRHHPVHRVPAGLGAGGQPAPRTGRQRGTGALGRCRLPRQPGH